MVVIVILSIVGLMLSDMTLQAAPAADGVHGYSPNGYVVPAEKEVHAWLVFSTARASGGIG